MQHTTSDRILVVEDDIELNQQIAQAVSEAGYQVDSCFDGEDALLLAARQQHRVLLLDIMLPRRDGITVLKMIRKTSQVPVILVSARGAEEDRIKGLQLGADDYITKPFNRTELLLRLEALLRRSRVEQASVSHTLVIDDLTLHARTQQVALADSSLALTTIQFKLLWELAQHQGEVLSKAYLSQKVLNRRLGAYDRGLDMHLSRVRKRLNQLGWSGERLQTVHGQGYCLS